MPTTKNKKIKPISTVDQLTKETPPAMAWVYALMGIIGIVMLFTIVMGGIVYYALKITGI